MAVNPMITSGVNGVQAGVRGLQQAAQELTSLNAADDADELTPPTQELSNAYEAIIDLKEHELQVQASAEVIATADAVIGMLIDTH